MDTIPRAAKLATQPPSVAKGQTENAAMMDAYKPPASVTSYQKTKTLPQAASTGNIDMSQVSKLTPQQQRAATDQKALLKQQQATAIVPAPADQQVMQMRADGLAANQKIVDAIGPQTAAGYQPAAAVTPGNLPRITADRISATEEEKALMASYGPQPAITAQSPESLAAQQQAIALRQLASKYIAQGKDPVTAMMMAQAQTARPAQSAQPAPYTITDLQNAQADVDARFARGEMTIGEKQTAEINNANKFKGVA